MKSRLKKLSILFATANIFLSYTASSQELQFALKNWSSENKQRLTNLYQSETNPALPKNRNPKLPKMDQESQAIKQLKDKLSRSQFQKLEGVNDLGGGDSIEVGSVSILDHFKRNLKIHLNALQNRKILTQPEVEWALKLTATNDQERISYISFSDPQGPFLRLDKSASPIIVKINEWRWWRTPFFEKEKYLFEVFLEILGRSQKNGDRTLAQLYPIFSMGRLRYHRYDFIGREQAKFNLDENNIKTIKWSTEKDGKIYLHISTPNSPLEKKIEWNSNHPLFSISEETDRSLKNGLGVLLNNSFKLSLFRKPLADCESKIKNGVFPKTIWTLDSPDMAVLCTF